MKKIFLITLSTILFSFIEIIQAENIPFTKSAKQELLVIENSYQKLTVKNTLTSLDYTIQSTTKGEFIHLSIEGYANSEKVGFPLLPVKKSLIEVPLGANISYKIKSYTTEEIKLSDYGILHSVVPAQAPLSKSNTGVVNFIMDQIAYQYKGYLPSDLVKIEKLGIMRGENLARLNICPFSYNPYKNTLLVYHDLLVEINFSGGDEAATRVLKQKNNSPLFEANQTMILNYKPLLEKDLITKSPVKYVIVSDPMFQATLQPFIQWKTKKGFKVIEAYTNNPLVGNTTSSIKSYLQTLYNSGTPSDPSPTYLLLVGDIAQVPTFPGTTATYPTDLPYGEYTGDFYRKCIMDVFQPLLLMN